MGLAGGVAAEALKWYRIRAELYIGIPDDAKSGLYLDGYLASNSSITRSYISLNRSRSETRTRSSML